MWPKNGDRFGGNGCYSSAMLVPSSSWSSILLLAAVSLPSAAAAETYYVSPGGDDDAAGTEAVPFATPDGCFTNMSSGDTCLFTTGTWSGTAINRYTPRWNACIGPSGSPGQPTVYAAAPGAAPVFESFGVSGSGAGATGTCQYIHIEGMHSTESFLVWSVDHIRVTGCEMEGGMDCDGNWSAVRFENAADILFDHNFVDRLADGGGCRLQALLTSFTTDRSVFEYNTFNADDGADPEYGAILMKDSPIDIDIRYNLVIGDHIRGSNQNGDGRLGSRQLPTL